MGARSRSRNASESRCLIGVRARSRRLASPRKSGSLHHPPGLLRRTRRRTSGRSTSARQRPAVCSTGRADGSRPRMARSHRHSRSRATFVSLCPLIRGCLRFMTSSSPTDGPRWTMEACRCHLDAMTVNQPKETLRRSGGNPADQAPARDHAPVVVQGMVPTMFAAISVRLVESHARTASAWVRASMVDTAAGLAWTACFSSSSVTIIS
jgi:hypothetical protein